MIRPAKKTDKEFIINAQIHMALETENFELDRAIVSKGVEKVLENKALGIYYVFELENEVVACLLTINEWSDWRNSFCLWIHSLYVSPNQRGKKIFKKMYQFLQNKVSKSEDYFGLRLYVDKTNTKAIDVYNGLGMSNEHYELFEWTADS